MTADTARPVSADHPLELWRLDHPWCVADGFVDLFAIRIDADRPVGRRMFLARLGQGRLILPLPVADGWAVLACGGQDSVATPAAGLADAELESWLATLCGAMVERPSTTLPAASPGSHALNPGDGIAGRGAPPLWARVNAGSATLGPAGPEVTPDQAPVPLAHGLWLTATRPLTVTLLPTRDLIAAGTLPAALDGFHMRAVAAIGRVVTARQDQLAATIADRPRQSRRMLEQGFDTLARLMGAGGGDDPAPTGDGALAVVGRVAARLGRGVVAPSALVTLPGPHGEVGRILRASGLRGRVVLLRDQWWREDGMALIGRTQDGHTPVALLPGPGGYVAWRPDQPGEIPVDATLAATLAVQALAVYPRFDTAALGPAAIAALGLRGARADLWRLAGLALGGALLALLTPMASSLLVEQIIPAAARDQLAILIGGLVIAAITTACLDLTKGMTLLRLEGRLDANLQSALFDRLLRLPAAFFKRFSAGDLTDRILGIHAIRQKLTGAAVTSLLGGIFSTISLALLFYYSAPLAAVAVGLALVSSTITAGLIGLQLRHERRLARVRGGVEGLVLQLINGVGKLHVAAARDRAIAHWTSRFAIQKRHALAAQAAARLQAVFMAAFPAAANAVVFLAMAYFAKQAMIDGQIKALAGGEATAAMGTGDFLAFNAALAQFLAAMTQSVRSLSDILGAVPLWERVRPVIDEPPEDGGERHSPGPLDGKVELANIGFRYVADGPMVLNGVSTTIEAGAFVALVGPSGSGKSTLIRLILGLEQASEGEIFFDGKPLSRLNLSHLRAQIGVVLQNARVLPGDIFHNIAGDSECRLEEAWDAAAQVGLDDDIRAMPMGMHTVLMDGGATLSGGQRQRLAIARALVRRPRILVLDEATSALDNRTQAVVTRSLARLGITRILIAHRLSTIADVDRIIVMDQGRIVQSGGHDQLLARPGLFADMARRQIL